MATQLAQAHLQEPAAGVRLYFQAGLLHSQDPAASVEVGLQVHSGDQQLQSPHHLKRQVLGPLQAHQADLCWLHDQQVLLLEMAQSQVQPLLRLQLADWVEAEGGQLLEQRCCHCWWACQN